MKFNPAFQSESRTRTRNPLGAAILLSTVMFAAVRGTATAAPSDDTSSDETTGGDDVTSQTTGTGTGTGTGTAAATKVSTKTIEEASVNTDLLAMVKAYDDVKEKANSYMCDMAEFIGKNNIGRPVLIKTLMEARGVTVETAASTASRLMKLAKDPEAIQGLRDGTITVRETLYGVKKKGATTEAGAGGDGAAGGAASSTNKKTDTEKKEDRYNRILGEFVDVAKECGFSLDEILTGVKASLKDKGVK